MTYDELEKTLNNIINKIKETPLFTVNEKCINKEQAQRFCNLLNEIDNTCFPFEPTPPDEPVGEIYRDGKLIGFIM